MKEGEWEWNSQHRKGAICFESEENNVGTSDDDKTLQEVCKQVSKGPPPEGYIVMTMKDVRNNSDLCKSVMSEWEVVALFDGKYDGPGYGSTLTGGNHLGCGYIGRMLIMTDDNRDP